MEEASRHALLCMFDKSRASFLASLDQVVAEMRPALLEVPGYYDGSILACASTFASRELVRSQLEEVSPGLLDQVEPHELDEAHLLTVAYLFSLILHEAIRNDRKLPEMPTMMEEEQEDA
jgi:hypothetical protein